MGYMILELNNIDMMLAAAPQPWVGGEQIQSWKQCVILSVYILCGKCKSCPVLFIYVCHGVFLAFYIFVESLAEGRTAYLPHGGCQYLCGCSCGYRDEYLRLRKANTDTSRLEVRDCGHKPFNSAVMWIIWKYGHCLFSLLWNRKSPPVFV